VAFARPQDAFVYVLLGGCDPAGASLVGRSAGRETVLVAADRLAAAAASWRRGADGWRRRGAR
jgi:hypothetical protein